VEFASTSSVSNLNSHSIDCKVFSVLGLGGGFSLQKPSSSLASKVCMLAATTLNTETCYVINQCQLMGEDYIRLQSSLKYSQAQLSQICLSIPANASPLFVKEINKLENDDTIIVREADKNLGLCAISTTRYNDEVLRQLNDTSMYQKISQDKALSDIRTLKGSLSSLWNPNKIWKRDFIHLFDTVLSQTKEQINFLPFFYIIPKLHKTPIVGRPIVPSNIGFLAILSCFVHTCLFPLLASAKTVSLNSTEIVKEVEATTWYSDDLQQNPVEIVTADINNMYNNMKLEMVEAVWLHSVRPDLSLTFNSHELDVIWFCMKALFTHSFLKYNGLYYVQLFGIAMGTPAAPVVTNIIIYGLEKVILTALDISLFSRFKIIWKRYIDDYLFIGQRNILAPLIIHVIKMITGTHGKCLYKNCTIPAIANLTFVRSFSSAIFLDLSLNLYTNTTGAIAISCDLYRKELNAFQHLSFYSAVPRAQLGGIIIGECIRILRASSRKQSFAINCLVFKNQLLKRGYSDAFVDRHMNKISFNMRLFYLLRTRKKSKKYLDCQYATKRWFPINYFDGIELTAIPIIRNWIKAVSIISDGLIEYGISYRNGGRKVLSILNKRDQERLEKLHSTNMMSYD
jgi:hypothetical protein